VNDDGDVGRMESAGMDGTSRGAARVVSDGAGGCAEIGTGCGESCFLDWRARRGAGFSSGVAVVAGAVDGDSPPSMAADTTGCAVAGAEVESVAAGAGECVAAAGAAGVVLSI
jgi:hypothetical protein